MLTPKRRVALLVALGLLVPILPTATAAEGDISISVTKWDRDTSKGTIAYDVTLRGSCSAYSCGWRLTGFYADGTIEEALRGIAVGTVYGSSTTPAFAKQVSGTLAPGEAIDTFIMTSQANAKGTSAGATQVTTIDEGNLVTAFPGFPGDG